MSCLGRSMIIVTPLLIVSLVCFGVAAYRFHAYETGFPTTATVDHCIQHAKGSTCYVTWNAGGQSQTGPIQGPAPAVGSSEEVRVSDGTAYAGSPLWAFALAVVAVIVLASLFIAFSYVLIRRWVRTAPTRP
jgi:hypothetical protein